MCVCVSTCLKYKLLGPLAFHLPFPSHGSQFIFKELNLFSIDRVEFKFTLKPSLKKIIITYFSNLFMKSSKPHVSYLNSV